ncbi:MAG: GspE/PulE family protein [Patescibacteria group bacterium]|nr:GspE/PulE family protein [Patescibacteria group bacterium]
MLKFNDEKDKQRLSELHSQEAERLAQTLATKYKLPYIDLSKVAINTDALRIVPEAEAREGQLAAFRVTGKHLYLALRAPAHPKAKAILKDLEAKNYILEKYLVSEAGLIRAWDRYKEISKSTRTEAGVIDISSADIDRFIEEIKDLEDLAQILEKESGIAFKEGGISDLLEIILAGGISTLASDIHIEPQEGKVRMRYRLDGVLKNVIFFHERLYKQILSRVKLISGLKLNVKKSAQDGRFSIRLAETDIEIRTSILPGAYGESTVLRILNPETIAVSFDTLGIESALLKIVNREISKPNGMVLLTGPTGSGKTTTLYAFLRKISTTANKIITIEDPIEYHLQGVNQTQVNSKQNYTFLSGLRSALRQDPDIIMIGEIRDSETAKIAVDSSLTGHLVFSTLHTNNAAGTIPRLIDLGVNPKVLDASLNIAMAQRLVRVLCKHCKVTDTPNVEEKKLLDGIVAAIKTKRPDLASPDTDQIWRPTKAGCGQCHHTGYRGQVGIFEGILVDPAISKLLISNPNEREIRLAAKPQGILDMREDGVMKVLSGITDLSELGRVVDIHEEIL